MFGLYSDGVEFIRTSGQKPARVGILPGSFNPPTIAHVELACAARFHVDEVVCVLPQVFPHKEYFGASLEQRLAMLLATEESVDSMFSVATSERGLFIDIARECRAHYGPTAELYFLCGADAAERIVNWDYGSPDYAAKMLEEFQLLVAPRGSVYEPPQQYRSRIHALLMRGDYHSVSSTEVRERIERRQPWEHLVPETIVDQVRGIYS